VKGEPPPPTLRARCRRRARPAIPPQSRDLTAPPSTTARHSSQVRRIFRFPSFPLGANFFIFSSHTPTKRFSATQQALSPHFPLDFCIGGPNELFYIYFPNLSFQNMPLFKERIKFCVLCMFSFSAKIEALYILLAKTPKPLDWILISYKSAKTIYFALKCLSVEIIFIL